MKAIGENYIDYWQLSSKQWMKNRFGIRIRDGRCWALVQLGAEDPFTFGDPYDIPVELSTLPSNLRIVVDDELLNYPTSDLVAVLSGKKSFQEALDSPVKIEPQRTIHKTMKVS